MQSLSLVASITMTSLMPATLLAATPAKTGAERAFTPPRPLPLLAGFRQGDAHRWAPVAILDDPAAAGHSNWARHEVRTAITNADGLRADVMWRQTPMSKGAQVSVRLEFEQPWSRDELWLEPRKTFR